MTPRETLLSQIAHRETPRVPYTLGCEDPALAVRLARHFGVERYADLFVPYMAGVGAVDANVERPVDETFAVDAFGTKWRMDKRPWHLEAPGMPDPDFGAYPLPGPGAFAVDGLKEKARTAIAQKPDSFRILHNGWGIFEQTWRIRGFQNALMDAAADPGFYRELVDRLTDLRLSMIAQFEGIDGDAVMFGDDWGDQRGIILGPDRWREFIKPAWARVYEAVHAQGKFVMSHSCGSVAEIIPDLIEIGLDVLESVQPEPAGMNPYELKRKFGDRITFWGCLGSQSTVQFGTPAEIKAEVKRLTETMARGGGYILAPAKSLQPGTPFENAVALTEAVLEL